MFCALTPIMLLLRTAIRHDAAVVDATRRNIWFVQFIMFIILVFLNLDLLGGALLMRANVRFLDREALMTGYYRFRYHSLFYFCLTFVCLLV